MRSSLSATSGIHHEYGIDVYCLDAIDIVGSLFQSTDNSVCLHGTTLLPYRTSGYMLHHDRSCRNTFFRR